MILTHLPLMQSAFISESDPVSIVIGAGIFIGFALFLIIAGISANKGNNSSRSKKGGYSRFAFKRRATAMGLSKAHQKTLLYIIDKFKPKNPFGLLTNGPILDGYLKRAIAEVESQVSSDSIKEAQKLTLFRIKQIIERNSQKAQIISNSKQLRTKQQVVIYSPDGTRYNSRVIANLRDVLALQIPYDDDSNQVRWKKWSTLKVFFWKNNGEAYSFQSKVTGYNLLKGVSCLFVQHVQKIHKAQQRRFRRRDLDKPAYFYPVRILTTGTGRNQTRKAYVESKRGALGTVIEVSSGGCSVRSSYPLMDGELIKIEFETGRGVQVSTFGKVVNYSPHRPMGGIMHIMFTRVSRANLNRINSFVYDYQMAERAM